MDKDATVNLKFVAPFTAMLVGPTGSGKTNFMFKLLDSLSGICDEPISKIIYCYGAWQPAFETKEKNINFHSGLVNVEELPDDKKHTVLIIDDLMTELSKSKEAVDLFTKHSHHKNISCIFIVQKLFGETAEFRTISGNTHHMFLFKNPRDASAISHLARQVYPENIKFLQEVFVDATELPFSHLLLNMHQRTESRARVVGNFLSTDPNNPTCVYIPKKR